MSDTISNLFGVSPPKVFAFSKKDEYTGFKINPVNPDLVVGVELETEDIPFRIRDEFVASLTKIGFKYTTDGSLRGSSGEFISLPMKTSTLIQALDKYRELTKFNESNFTDRCSVHVHVNCTNLTVDNLTSLVLVYTTVEDVLFKFVGHGRESNIYCIPWSQCRNHLNLVTNFLSGRSKDVAHGWQKYTALNLLPLGELGTVEFRHLYGTLDPTVLSHWLNIIGSLFNYSVSTPSSQVIEEIKSLNSTSQYESFFTKVLGGTLPYSNEYSMMLESGVILAKYSLETKVPSKKWKNMTSVIFDELPVIAREYPAEELAQGYPRVSALMERPRIIGGTDIRNPDFHNLWNTARVIEAVRNTPPEFSPENDREDE